jgi:hypothetical protein
MYFIYVDESGTSGTDAIQHYFVLTAIIVRTDRCIHLQEGLQKLKEEFHFKDVEIKGRDIEQSKNFFRHISLQTKRDFVKRLFQLLFAHDLFLSTIVFSKEEDSIKRLNLSSEDVYHLSYKELLKHLEEFLEERNEVGLLLIDSRASSIRSHLRDDRLIRVHQEYLKRLAQQKRQTRIIEYPIFIQSEFFAAVQLADLCAYNIFRALQVQFGIHRPDKEHLGEVASIPAIRHEEFRNEMFLDHLFSHPDIDLPVLARLLSQKGKIVKLP